MKAGIPLILFAIFLCCDASVYSFRMISSDDVTGKSPAVKQNLSTAINGSKEGNHYTIEFLPRKLQVDIISILYGIKAFIVDFLIAFLPYICDFLCDGYDLCLFQGPTGVAPSIAPTIFPNGTVEPSSDTSVFLPPSLPSGPQADGNSVPSHFPSHLPSTSFIPSIGEDTLNSEITCVAVIDEQSMNGGDNGGGDNIQKWKRFREQYPDRPFCLLQPSYSSYESLNLPFEFQEESGTLTTYIRVNRDEGCDEDKYDWFDLCDFDGLREEGITRVAFFIDQSGSMTTKTVWASYNYFLHRLNVANVKIVTGIYNGFEDWISPFNKDFGYGDEIYDPTENCDVHDDYVIYNECLSFDGYNEDDFMCDDNDNIYYYDDYYYDDFYYIPNIFFFLFSPYSPCGSIFLNLLFCFF